MEKEIILITGSSGLIGGVLAKKLCTKYQIVALDYNEPKEKITGIIYKTVNIASKKSIEDALIHIQIELGTRISSVIHLAAYYSFSGKKSTKYKEITVDGSRIFLLLLKKYFVLEQFIFSSTMLVHSPAELGQEISEKSPVYPSWPYPQSKIEAEEALQNEHGDVPIVKLRIAGVYNDYCNSIPLAQNISRIYEQQLSAFLFPGNPFHGQAFLHLQDLADAISAIIEKRQKLGSNLNLLLGEDKVLNYKELQTQISKQIHGHGWPVLRIPKFLAKLGSFIIEHLPFARKPFIKPWMIEYADEHYDLDISKAKKLLDWEPKRNLPKTLPLMIQALLENPEKWYSEHKIEKPHFRIPILHSENTIYRIMAGINIFLGIWLMSNPFTLGYDNDAIFWSDLLIGFFIANIAALSMIPSLRWTRWINSLLASTLLFFPLLFWTNSSAIYSNNTILGCLILLLSAYTPSRSSKNFSKKDIPNGWSYNPSAWLQRFPIMTLAFLGFLAARYLAAFQLGHIPRAWDPFFTNGTEKILLSDISRAFPISDAGLGAVSYILDVISASIGDKRRWKTMPWMVLLFGILIIPSGITSIVLVMLQPIAVQEWCTLCLFTAAVMLLMVPPAIDEVAASIQYISQSRKNGNSFWKTFWLGSRGESIHSINNIHPAVKRVIPTHMYVSTLIGIWLMFTPAAFSIQGAAANNIYIIAALVTTFAVIACAEIARPIRILNAVLGSWITASAWFIGDMQLEAKWHSMSIGILLILFSIPRGKITQHFGSLDSWAQWSIFPLAESAEKTKASPHKAA